MSARLEFPELKPDDVYPAAAKLVSDSKQNDYETLSMSNIKLIVGAYFGVGENDIISHRRSLWMDMARHIAMYFCDRLTTKTSTQIGIAFCRDHTTILYGKKKISGIISKDETIKKYVDDLSAIFEDWR